MSIQSLETRCFHRGFGVRYRFRWGFLFFFFGSPFFCGLWFSFFGFWLGRLAQRCGRSPGRSRSPGRGVDRLHNKLLLTVRADGGFAFEFCRSFELHLTVRTLDGDFHQDWPTSRVNKRKRIEPRGPSPKQHNSTQRAPKSTRPLKP